MQHKRERCLRMMRKRQRQSEILQAFKPNPVVQSCRALVGEHVATQADAVPADFVRAGSWGSISHEGRKKGLRLLQPPGCARAQTQVKTLTIQLKNSLNGGPEGPHVIMVGRSQQQAASNCNTRVMEAPAQNWPAHVYTQALAMHAMPSHNRLAAPQNLLPLHPTQQPTPKPPPARDGTTQPQWLQKNTASSAVNSSCPVCHHS